LPELDFELPLAGGDEARPSSVVLADLVPLWRHHVPTGLLASYADALAELPDVPLRGYLTGSIDVVLRVGGAAGPRYLVVDYKTNRLGGYDEPLTAWHYRSAALETAMVEAHYPLQAVLYAVALHRYLRWRQPAYDPEVHLGGVLYLFLRGMSGPGVLDASGAAPGVFAWRPPAALVVGLSDLLAGTS
jgi:exodeoxyribonuclease V beta subunit